jgi:hypothetical protein
LKRIANMLALPLGPSPQAMLLGCLLCTFSSILGLAPSIDKWPDATHDAVYWGPQLVGGQRFALSISHL